jgi:hypothetical protein
MKLPNAEMAVIEQAKLVDYVLNVEHVYGGAKARLLQSLGYTVDEWPQLESDIRAQFLPCDVAFTKDTPWGMRYEIVAPLAGPVGKAVVFRSIWQIDRGTDAPRLITMYPE